MYKCYKEWSVGFEKTLTSAAAESNADAAATSLGAAKVNAASLAKVASAAQELSQ